MPPSRRRTPTPRATVAPRTLASVELYRRGGFTLRDAAATTGVSHESVRKLDRVLDRLDGAVVEALRRGEMSVDRAVRLAPTPSTDATEDGAP